MMDAIRENLDPILVYVKNCNYYNNTNNTYAESDKIIFSMYYADGKANYKISYGNQVDPNIIKIINSFNCGINYYNYMNFIRKIKNYHYCKIKKIIDKLYLIYFKLNLYLCNDLCYSIFSFFILMDNNSKYLKWWLNEYYLKININ